jgi:hypothetical protein
VTFAEGGVETERAGMQEILTNKATHYIIGSGRKALHYWRQKEKDSFIGWNEKSRRDTGGATKMQ